MSASLMLKHALGLQSFRDSFSVLSSSPSIFHPYFSVATFIICLQYQNFISICGPFFRQLRCIHCDSQLSSFCPFFLPKIKLLITPLTHLVLYVLSTLQSLTREQNCKISQQKFLHESCWKRWLFFYREKIRYLKQESIDNGNKAASMKRGLFSLRDYRSQFSPVSVLRNLKYRVELHYPHEEIGQSPFSRVLHMRYGIKWKHNAEVLFSPVYKKR